MFLAHHHHHFFFQIWILSLLNYEFYMYRLSVLSLKTFILLCQTMHNFLLRHKYYPFQQNSQWTTYEQQLQHLHFRWSHLNHNRTPELLIISNWSIVCYKILTKDGPVLNKMVGIGTVFSNVSYLYCCTFM